MKDIVRSIPEVRIAQTNALSDLQLDGAAWAQCEAVRVDRYWSGEPAAAGRSFEARLLWSDKALYVRFDAEQSEPIVASTEPDLTAKTIGLWDRDVCEIFVAPDAREPRKYFEFEVAPTGEWLDVALDLTSGSRESDWEYASGMKTAARIETGKVVMAMQIPWEAFGVKPRKGGVWLGNLFRCVGRDPGRGYLTWSPTLTTHPNFHVPEAFGEMRFD